LHRQVGEYGLAPVSAVINKITSLSLTLEGMSRLVARASGEFDVISNLWIVPEGGLPRGTAQALQEAAKTLPAEISWKDAAIFARDLLRRNDLSDDIAVGLLVAGLGNATAILLGPDASPIAVRHRAIDLGEACYLILQEARRPLALRELGRLVLARFGKWAPERIEQKIGTAVQDDDRFAQVSNGTYDLSSRFPIMGTEQERILDLAYGILRSLRRPTDTSFLVKKIRQQSALSPALNRYSLYWMLRRDQRFRVVRRLHVSLREWRETISGAPFAAALMNVLEEAGRPLTERQVHKRLSAVRAPHLYGVSQGLERLARQGRIMKLAPQTFAAFSTLQVSPEVSGAIHGGIRKFIEEQGLPIVARFLREWLVSVGADLADISDGHVDAVLFGDPRLVRIGYGVYVPADVTDAWRGEPIAVHAVFVLRKRDGPIPSAELLWILEEAHRLSGARIWERLLAAGQFQLYPSGYIGLQEWGALGWQKALAVAWDNVVSELRAAQGSSPDWLTTDAVQALKDLAQAKGELWILGRIGQQESTQEARIHD
jgi:hypothetical protein